MFDFQKIYTVWNWKRIRRHLIYWVMWLVFFAATNTSNSDMAFWSWIKLELIVMTVKVPYVYLLIYFLVPRYLIKKRVLTFFLYVGITAFIGGILIWLLNLYIIYPNIFKIPPDFVSHTKAIYKGLDLIQTAMIPVVIKLMQQQFLQEQQTRQLLGEKLNAELQMLKNQLQPHFLFNTLNNLYGRIFYH